MFPKIEVDPMAVEPPEQIPVLFPVAAAGAGLTVTVTLLLFEQPVAVMVSVSVYIVVVVGDTEGFDAVDVKPLGLDTHE